MSQHPDLGGADLTTLRLVVCGGALVAGRVFRFELRGRLRSSSEGRR